MSNTTVQPPPERDLPAGRQAAMRAQLLREISGDSRRRSGPHRGFVRRNLVPLTVAAAVLLVVAGVLAVSRQHTDRTDRGLVATQPAVPGFEPAELEALRNGCIAALRSEDSKDQYFDLDEAVAYNALNTRRGPVVLLYAPDGLLNCSYVRSVNSTSPPGLFAEGISVEGEPSGWLPGAATVDFGTSSGEDAGDWHTIGGRVPPGVTRVEVSIGRNDAAVDVVNGTYLLTLTLTSAVELSDRPVIRTFDERGALVGTYPSRRRESTYCVVTPDGTQIEGDPQRDTSTCEKAVPWR